MHISLPKTNDLHVHVHKQDPRPCGPTLPEETKTICKFKCPHVGFDNVFMSVTGLKIYTNKCKWKQEFVFEKIPESKGPTTKRM